MSLLTRLKGRKPVQWALAYLAGASAVLQVTDMVLGGVRLGGHRSIQTTKTAYGHSHEDVAAALARGRIYKEGGLRVVG
jgi:hypothetical protein